MGFLTQADWLRNEQERDDLQKELRETEEERCNDFTRLPKCLPKPKDDK